MQNIPLLVTLTLCCSVLQSLLLIIFFYISISHLDNLTYLSLGENNVIFLPAEIGERNSFKTGVSLKRKKVQLNIFPVFLLGSLEKLEKLFLNNNPNFHELPYELAFCQSLSILDIDGCPLTSLPPEVFEGGSSVVMQVRLLYYMNPVKCYCH